MAWIPLNDQVVGCFVVQGLTQIIPFPKRFLHLKWTKTATCNMLGHLLQPASWVHGLGGQHICLITAGQVVVPKINRRFAVNRPSLAASPLRQEAYIMMSNIAFIPFSCFTHPNGSESLLTATNILCGSAEHRNMQVFGAILGSLAWSLVQFRIATKILDLVAL